MRQVAPGDILAAAAAILAKADVQPHAPIETQVGVRIGRALVQPGHEIVIGFDLLIALQRAAEPHRFEPSTLIILQQRPGPRDVGQGGCAHHAARHHEARMRPLSAKQRINLDRLAGHGDAGLIRCAGERRETLHRLLVEAAAAILLVGHVDRVQAIEIPRLALQALGDLAQVARQDGVARHLGLPCGVQRPGGASQVRRAADAAGARRHHEARLRVLVAQDDLKAAEQLGLGPRIGHDAVLDVDTHVEVALDPADGRDVECLYWHGSVPSIAGVRRRTCPVRPRPGRRSWRRRSARCSRACRRLPAGASARPSRSAS